MAYRTARLLGQLHSYGEHNVLSPLPGVCLIRTEWSARDIRDDLREHLGQRDRLLAWTVTGKAAAWEGLGAEQARWIRQAP